MGDLACCDIRSAASTGIGSWLTGLPTGLLIGRSLTAMSANVNTVVKSLTLKTLQLPEAMS